MDLKPPEPSERDPSPSTHKQGCALHKKGAINSSSESTRVQISQDSSGYIVEDYLIISQKAFSLNCLMPKLS